MASSTAKCRRKQARAERGRAALRGSLALDWEQRLAKKDRRIAELEEQLACHDILSKIPQRPAAAV